MLTKDIREEETLTVDQITVKDLLNIFDIIKQDMKRFAEIYQLDENEQESAILDVYTEDKQEIEYLLDDFVHGIVVTEDENWHQH